MRSQHSFFQGTQRHFPKPLSSIRHRGIFRTFPMARLVWTAGWQIERRRGQWSPSQTCRLSTGDPSPQVQLWAHILSLPRASCGNLDKFLNLSQPVSPLSSGGVNSVYYCTVLVVRVYLEQSSRQYLRHHCGLGQPFLGLDGPPSPFCFFYTNSI